MVYTLKELQIKLENQVRVHRVGRKRTVFEITEAKVLPVCCH